MEPLSTGAAAAKAAENALDSSIAKALLHPAATELGAYLGERAAEFTDRLRRKRQENLLHHLAVYASITGQDAFESVNTDPAFESWIKGAADVDPSDEHLSAIWEAALVILASKQIGRHRVLRVVKALAPDEAAVFAGDVTGTKEWGRFTFRYLVSHRFRIRTAMLRHSYRNRFIALGLLEPPVNPWSTFGAAILLLSTVLCTAVFFVELGHLGETAAEVAARARDAAAGEAAVAAAGGRPDWMRLPFWLLLPALTSFAVSVLFWMNQRSREFTPDGEALMQMVNKVWRAKQESKNIAG